MTTDSINLDRVYALVVGIEKYKGGSEWDLDGPVRDGLKFANWLLERRIKPEQIQLFLSPLDRNAGVIAEAKAQGLNPVPADRNQIDTAIRSKLTTGNQGDLLYVFWGGHGIVTKTNATTRRLFFADTDNINQWNLNFNSLVEALSTFAHGSGFTRQNFWIDACANAYYQGLYQTIAAESAESRFSTNGEQGTAAQFGLFAAAEYEVATNESAVGTGRFSRAVLDQLQGQPLLPDMKALTERIQTDFRSRQQSEPVYFWAKGRGYEEEEDRLDRSSIVVPQKHQPLSSAQQLKLEYLRSKGDDLKSNQQKLVLQKKGVLPHDILTKDALENHICLVIEEIAQVEQEIQKLEQGNG